MFKRLLFLAAAMTLVLTFLVSAHLTPASAHSAVSTHAGVVEVAAKKHHHYHGVLSAHPSWIVLDIAGNANTTLVFRHAVPKGIYIIESDVFPLCATAFLEPEPGVVLGPNVIQVDRFGNATANAFATDCVPGTAELSARLSTTPFTVLEVKLHLLEP